MRRWLHARPLATVSDTRWCKLLLSETLTWAPPKRAWQAVLSLQKLKMLHLTERQSNS